MGLWKSTAKNFVAQNVTSQKKREESKKKWYCMPFMMTAMIDILKISAFLL